MMIRMKGKLKNQQGSSLTFVLIIGMIILIMVVSLLTVANGDFNFTQQTVESRQAYLDAKSVIEFGKIEINDRMAGLVKKNNDLKALYEELALLTENAQIEAKQEEIQEKIDDINQYVNNILMASYYIGGNVNDITKTLLKTNDSSSAVGVLSVIRETDTTNPGVSRFTFDIKTQSLRRKLDYKVSFNSSLTSATPVTPGEPGDIPSRAAGDWYPTWITANNGSKSVKCVITTGGGGGKVDYSTDGTTLKVPAGTLNLEIGKENGAQKFEWNDDKILDLSAGSIDVVVPLPQNGVSGAQFNLTAVGDSKNAGTIYFEQGYQQVNGEKNTLTATDIIIKGDLVIDRYSYLEINCVNLWVTGDIIINTDVADSTFVNRITASNIIVGGTAPNNTTISITNDNRVVWNYNTFYLNGSVTTAYTNSGNVSEPKFVITPGVSDKEQEKYY